MQGFRVRSRSAKSEREGAEAMLIESVFQDNNPECLTHAKRIAEASKVFLLSCNFESPAHASAFLGRELGETPMVDELDELDELDESELEKKWLHTVSCADILALVYELDELDESELEKKWLHTVSCADILALVYELEREKSTRRVTVFLARKDNKPAKRFTQFWKFILLSANFESPAHGSAFLGRELGETQLVDELDESELEKKWLHTVSCADILALVYELEPETSAVCVAVFLARKDCALALLGRELEATLLEEFEKPALQMQIEIVLQNDRTDRMAVIWAPQDCGVDGFFAVALSEDNKVLVLKDPEYVHYNTETINLTSSQDKHFMLLKKTSVSNSANQHKCPARSQGREIFSSSCNALPIVTKDDAVIESSKILWLPIKHGARVSQNKTLWLIKQRAQLCQKNKMGITFLIMITMLGWIPGVKAAEKNASALVQGSTTTSTVVCVVIGTVASLYLSYKFLKWFRLPPPDWTLFSRKLRIRTEGNMESAEMHFELFDEEDKHVGSWNCPYFIEHEDGVDMVDMVSWGTHLFNMMLHIFVEQEGGEEEISFNQMDHPDFINTAKDVYFHNPDTGLLHYIGRSPPRNDLPGERGTLRKRIADANADTLGFYSGNYQVRHLQAS